MTVSEEQTITIKQYDLERAWETLEDALNSLDSAFQDGEDITQCARQAYDEVYHAKRQLSEIIKEGGKNGGKN